MRYYKILYPAQVPVTLRQLTNAPYTSERGDDSGKLTCKAVKPYFEYDKVTGKQSTNQIGWKYQCRVDALDVTIFVKVADKNCAVTEAELKKGPVDLGFIGFKGIWWIDKDNQFQLSCKADFVERR